MAELVNREATRGAERAKDLIDNMMNIRGGICGWIFLDGRNVEN